MRRRQNRNRLLCCRLILKSLTSSHRQTYAIAGDVLVPWGLLTGLNLLPSAICPGMQLSGRKTMIVESSQWLATEVLTAKCIGQVQKGSEDQRMGVVLEGSVPVLVRSIIQGSLCDRDGLLRVGDEISKVCGVTVQSHSHASKLLREIITSPASGTLTIEFQRRRAPPPRFASESVQTDPAWQVTVSSQTETAVARLETERHSPPVRMPGSTIFQLGDGADDSFHRQCSACYNVCGANDLELFCTHVCSPLQTFTTGFHFANSKQQQRMNRTERRSLERRASSLTSPYDECRTEAILLIGEADFSFALSVAVLLSKVPFKGRLVATTLEREDTVLHRFAASQVSETLQRLQLFPFVSIRFEVDGRNIAHSFWECFDLIGFMFPHTGIEKSELPSANTDLISDFLSSCKAHLNEGGMVHLALLQGQFKSWDVKQSLDRHGFRVSKKIAFNPSWFPQYKNSRGFKEGQFVPELTLDDAVFHTIERRVDTGTAVSKAFGEVSPVDGLMRWLTQAGSQNDPRMVPQEFVEQPPHPAVLEAVEAAGSTGIDITELRTWLTNRLGLVNTVKNVPLQVYLTSFPCTFCISPSPDPRQHRVHALSHKK